MNHIISTENLQVGYDKKIVVENVEIEGLKGQIICLLGPNGVGKSTILRTLSGLLAPVEGSVQMEGQDIFSMKKLEMAKKLSVVLTNTITPKLLTVTEIVSMGRTPYTGFFGRLSEADKKIVDEAIKTVGGENLKHRFYTELSDGEKQKIMIARALVQEPELIILDEPTSHLDIKHKVEVVRILRKLVKEKGITVILSLHDIDLAIKGCQTVMMIKEGKIVSMGTPEDIIYDGAIGDLYNVSGAKYIESLGSVELFGEGERNDVFVVSGAGTGIKIYRALSRDGIGMSSGVLHENDIDYQISQAICETTIVQKAFSNIDSSNYKLALMEMEHKSTVIDSGFPIGEGNQKNIDIIKYAIEQHKTIFSLRTQNEGETIFGINKNIKYCKNINELLNEIKRKL